MPTTKSKNQEMSLHLVYFKDMKYPFFGSYTLL